jgi:MYND finger
MIHVCVACHKESSPDEKYARCSACRIVRYCCPECQRRHWPSHKQTCSEQARIHEQDRFITRLNDLIYARFVTLSSLAMILLGTDGQDATRSVVIHVTNENRRAKVIGAHTRPRASENEGDWTRRDEMAAQKPDAMVVVAEFMYVKGRDVTLYSRLLSVNSANDMAADVAKMREDMDTYVRMAIDSLNE